jgi:hypothetical protein
MPGMPGPALPGFMGVMAGRVLQRNPPVSVCHQVSTMMAFALADLLVVPFPDFGLDGLAHGGHVFEMVVVFGRFIRADLAQGANGRGRRVEDIDIQVLGDAPGASGIRIGGNPS